MKRAKGCLLVAFIFACGFLIGGFLGAAFGWVGFFHKVVKGGPKAVSDIVMERALHDLALKPAQQTQVRTIISETAAELGKATDPVRPEVEAVLGDAEQRIREVLDDKQRAKFDSFAEQGRRRWKTPAAPSATTPPPETPSAQPDTAQP